MSRDDEGYVDHYERSLDDAGAEYWEALNDVKEKFNKATQEYEAEAQFSSRADAIDNLFGEGLYSARNDDHQYRDRTNKDGETEVRDEFRYSDDITAEDVFGTSSTDHYGDHKPEDVGWYGKENPPVEHDDEGKRIFRGTDPEDETNEQWKHERIGRVTGSSLDPAGKAIYYTKSVRKARGGIKTYRDHLLDPGGAKIRRIEARKKREAKDPEERRRDEQLKYVKQKLRKAGKPVPVTDDECARALAEHNHTQAERALRARVAELIQLDSLAEKGKKCVKQTAYNRFDRMVKSDEPETQALLTTYINRALGSRDGCGTAERPICERCSEQPAQGIRRQVGRKPQPPAKSTDHLEDLQAWYEKAAKLYPNYRPVPWDKY